ncbi:MAG: AAA family ATPase [Desulfovibrio sp.]|nr:AAA family ATPase [Desulfovibrio sp.]
MLEVAMYIESFKIDGFGIFAGAVVESLSPGLSIFMGDNEAGKSTCLEFLRVILTGYPASKAAIDKLAPVRGGSPGGSLVLRTDGNKTLHVTRKPGGLLKNGGLLSLADSDGHPLKDSGLLQAIFHGISANVYRAVFGFSLYELQTFDTLTQGNVSSALYGASFGPGLTPPGVAQQNLDNKMKRILAGDKNSPSMADYAAELEQLTDNIKAVTARHEQYDEFASELDKKRSLLTEQRGRKNGLDKERARLQHRLDLWKLWDDWRKAGKELESLAPDSALRDALPEMNTLAQHKSLYQNAVNSQSELSASLTRAREEKNHFLHSLGEGWDCARIRATDRSLHQAAVNNINRANDEIECARRAVDKAEPAIDRENELLQETDLRLKSNLASSSAKNLPLMALGLTLIVCGFALLAAYWRFDVTALPVTETLVLPISPLFGCLALLCGVTFLAGGLLRSGLEAKRYRQEREYLQKRRDAYALHIALQKQAAERMQGAEKCLCAAKKAWNAYTEGLGLGKDLEPATVRAALVSMEKFLAAEAECGHLTKTLAENSKNQEALRAPLQELLVRLERLPLLYANGEPDWATTLDMLLKDAQDASDRHTKIATRKQIVEDALRRAADKTPLEEFLASFSPDEEAGLMRNRSDLEGKYAALQEAEQEIQGNIAVLDHTVKTLSTADDLAELRQRWEAVQEALRVMCLDWARHALAYELIAQAQRQFQNEHQPRIVRDVSAMFKSITGGRWRGISVSLADSSLNILPDHGASLSPESLSRGAQEQVYLALRLAYIKNHARQACALPLVMDDVLVNFDPTRAERTANALVQFTEKTGDCPSHQILYFTCHPHTVDALSKAAPNAALFRIEDGRIRA